MPQKPRFLGVISARAGSKGVPGKNIKELCGKPLIAYMIEAAAGAKLLDRVIVSTESPRIAEAARACGADVPFLRPEEYATDDVSLTAVIKHAMEFFDAAGERYDAVASLQPTSPLTLPEDIDACVARMLETGCDASMTMRAVEEEHPFRIYNFDGDRVTPFNEATTEDLPQRQDRPPAFKMSGAVIIRKRKWLERWNGRDFAFGEDRRGVLVPMERSVDINAPLDFLVAETLMRLRLQQEEKSCVSTGSP